MDVRIVCCSVVLAGCFPHPDCSTPKLELEWAQAAWICPDPSRDAIRFVIAGEPHTFACNAYPHQEIDASRWVGSAVDVVMEIVDASGNVLQSDHQTKSISAGYESGDYQCEGYTSFSFYTPPPDAGID